MMLITYENCKKFILDSLKELSLKREYKKFSKEKGWESIDHYAIIARNEAVHQNNDYIRETIDFIQHC